MRPKEIQELLGINAGNIKDYKKKGIFTPEHPPKNNQSTDYTELDLQRLRRIVVLLKSGLTCADIKKLQIGKCSLENAIHYRQNYIEAKLEQYRKYRNALSMMSELLNDDAEYGSFDVDHYWHVIQEREAAGEEFCDVFDTFDSHPVSLIRNITCPCCKASEEVNLEEYVYDQRSDEYENGMGPDIVYSFDTEDVYECPKCGNTIHISGWIREYPIGAYDSENIVIENESE